MEATGRFVLEAFRVSTSRGHGHQLSDTPSRILLWLAGQESKSACPCRFRLKLVMAHFCSCHHKPDKIARSKSSRQDPVCNIVRQLVFVACPQSTLATTNGAMAPELLILGKCLLPVSPLCKHFLLIFTNIPSIHWKLGRQRKAFCAAGFLRGQFANGMLSRNCHRGSWLNNKTR